MAAISTIIAGITAAAALAATGKSLASKGPKQNQFMPEAAPLPAGPPSDLSASELAGKRPGSEPEAPNFLQLSSGMTPLQRRAAIATYGTSGDDSRYRDPATKDYYKNLVLYDVAKPEGLGSLLPVEQQYITNVFGQKPQSNSTESFLSALLRS